MGDPINEDTLILLDLDETCIHTLIVGEDEIPKTKRKSHKYDGDMIIFQRNGLQEFLKFLHSKFKNVGVFTAASRDYAVEIIKEFNIKPKYFFFRDHCALLQERKINEFLSKPPTEENFYMDKLKKNQLIKKLYEEQKDHKNYIPKETKKIIKKLLKNENIEELKVLIPDLPQEYLDLYYDSDEYYHDVNIIFYWWLHEHINENKLEFKNITEFKHIDKHDTKVMKKNGSKYVDYLFPNNNFIIIDDNKQVKNINKSKCILVEPFEDLTDYTSNELQKVKLLLMKRFN